MPLELYSSITCASAIVDSGSNALRVTPYATSGIELNPTPVGSYFIAINIRQTAATAAGTIVWAMRMGSERVAKIRQGIIVTGFDGTAAASTSRYSLAKFYGGTPTGGTQIGTVKRSSSFPASGVADARFTDTGITFSTTALLSENIQQDDAVHGGLVFSNPRGVTSTRTTSYFSVGTFNEIGDTLKLLPGEGISLRLSVAAVIGDTINGYFMWDEFMYTGNI